MIDNRDCTLCIYYRPFGAGCRLGMGNEPCYKYQKYRTGSRTHDDKMFDEAEDRWQGWSDYDREHERKKGSGRLGGDF